MIEWIFKKEIPHKQQEELDNKINICKNFSCEMIKHFLSVHPSWYPFFDDCIEFLKNPDTFIRLIEKQHKEEIGKLNIELEDIKTKYDTLKDKYIKLLASIKILEK